MPARKKTTSITDATTPPKKTAKRTALPRKKIAEAAAPPPRARVLSAEEKHQLIMAHAAMRQPVDRVQRFSLWIGVFVCVAVIGVGWLYTIRQSIAGAIDDSWKRTLSTQASDVFDQSDQPLMNELNIMLEQINTMQDGYLEELRTQTEVYKNMSESIGAVSSSAATSSVDTEAIRGDLFQPSDEESESASTGFNLPAGVTVD